ncbi:MAG: hypothetical protein AAFO75_10025 [Pseudomonadota bacterium]
MVFRKAIDRSLTLETPMCGCGLEIAMAMARFDAQDAARAKQLSSTASGEVDAAQGQATENEEGSKASKCQGNCESCRCEADLARSFDFLNGLEKAEPA